MSTNAYKIFEVSLNAIKEKVSQDIHLNQLLFANIITAFEAYLQTVALGLMRHDISLIKKVVQTNKFKNQKVPLSTAVTNDMQRYVTSIVQNIVFHNLAEVEPLFREAWNVKIPITTAMLDAIAIRHDIIHRNGYTKQNAFHDVSVEQVHTVAGEFDKQAINVDGQIEKLFVKPGSGLPF